jgi:hypothetical protein
MRPIIMVTPSSVILNSPLVSKILVTVQLDMATLRGSTLGIRPNVKMLVYRGPVQCQTKDETDTTIKDPFDPIARVTPLMIRGTDLEILEYYSSILNTRRFPASRDWRLGSFTLPIGSQLRLGSRASESGKDSSEASWTLYSTLGGKRAAAGTRRRSER